MSTSADSAKTIREWLSFGLGAVGMVAGVVIWFYTQIGALEDDVAANYVKKDVYTLRIQTLEDKISKLEGATVAKSDMKIVGLQVGILQKDFDNYTKKEAESWTAVRRSSKEIRDMVITIQLTLAKLTQ